MDVSAEELIQMFQARFPREFEIAVLTVQNTKMQQQQQRLQDRVDESETE